MSYHSDFFGSRGLLVTCDHSIFHCASRACTHHTYAPISAKTHWRVRNSSADFSDRFFDPCVALTDFSKVVYTVSKSRDTKRRLPMAQHALFYCETCDEEYEYSISRYTCLVCANGLTFIRKTENRRAK